MSSSVAMDPGKATSSLPSVLSLVMPILTWVEKSDKRYFTYVSPDANFSGANFSRKGQAPP